MGLLNKIYTSRVQHFDANVTDIEKARKAKKELGKVMLKH